MENEKDRTLPPVVNNTREAQWSDPRFGALIMLFPLGVLVDVCATLFLLSMPYILFFTPKGGGGSLSRKLGILCFIVFAIFVCCYYLMVFYQIFFVELKQKFISWQVIRRDDVFNLRGYYFKRDSFRSADIKSVEPYYADRRRFSKEMGTLLTRTRWSNLNYRVELKDGRVLYLPGEMERVEELKALLAGLVLNP